MGRLGSCLGLTTLALISLGLSVSSSASTTLELSAAVAKVEKALPPYHSLLGALRARSLSLRVRGSRLSDQTVAADAMIIRSSSVEEDALSAARNSEAVPVAFVSNEETSLSAPAATTLLLDQSIAYAAASSLLGDLAASRRIAVSLAYARSYASSLYVSWKKGGHPPLVLPDGSVVTASDARAAFEAASEVSAQRAQIDMSRAETYLLLHAHGKEVGGSSLRTTVQGWMTVQVASRAVHLSEVPSILSASELPGDLPSMIR